jgi:hypothetical protein
MSNTRRATMLNIDPAYKFLIDNYKGELPIAIKTIIQKKVISTRQVYACASEDRLTAKLAQYGNSGNWGAKMLRELSRVIYNNKNPEGDVGNWISVEIECFFTSENREAAAAKRIRALGYSKYVTFKRDGSLNPHDESCDQETEDGDGCSCGVESHGKEVVVTFPKNDYTILFKVCDILNELGCWVNRTCGLHVHFDMRSETPRMVTLMAQRMAYSVPALKTMLPKSRRDNQYCVNTINGRRNGSRYAFVNMQSLAKYGTLEIRGHSGTTDAQKIAHWIDLCRAIMSTKTIKANVGSLDVVLHLANVSETLKAYCLERRAKFSPEVSSGVDQVMDDNEESVRNNTMPLVLQPTGTDASSSVTLTYDGMPF